MDGPPNATPIEILASLRTQDQQLRVRVNHVLTLQRGDPNRMEDARQRAMDLSEAAETHQDVFPPEEYGVFQRSMQGIVRDLDIAIYEANEPSDAPPLQVVQANQSGQSGRPRIEIDATFLQAALRTRGPKYVGELLGVSSRTVRRRALELQLVEPQPPVFSTVEAEDGTRITLHQTSTRPVSTMTDDQVTEFIVFCRQLFPTIGVRQIQGYLTNYGHNVPVARVSELLRRIEGTPGDFGIRPISRRVYRVAGPNALWHHDGQHGLIKFGFVIHAFIDGHSRLVVGIRVNNNNRAQSVLDLFLAATTLYGTPVRVRGDHGTENLQVAGYMAEHFGADKYIWGPSVHNSRIERLWYDVTNGFGRKWKEFFQDLEANDGLNTAIPAHKWLLSHLFLAALNEDAVDWQGYWNHHKMSIRGQRTHTPYEMFMFDQLRRGPRGLHPQVRDAAQEVEDIGDVRHYGIDWEALRRYNEGEQVVLEDIRGFFEGVQPNANVPRNLANVPCEPAACPLDEEDVIRLDDHLHAEFPHRSRTVLARRQLWYSAIDFCQQISDEFH